MSRNPLMLKAVQDTYKGIRATYARDMDPANIDTQMLLEHAFRFEAHEFATPPSPTNGELFNIVQALSVSAPVHLARLLYHMCQTRDRVNTIMSTFEGEILYVEDLVFLMSVGTTYNVPESGVGYIECVDDNSRIQLNMLIEAALVGTLIDIFCFDKQMLERQMLNGKRIIKKAITAIEPVWAMSRKFTREMQYIPYLISCMEDHDAQMNHIIEGMSTPLAMGELLN